MEQPQEKYMLVKFTKSGRKLFWKKLNLGRQEVTERFDLTSRSFVGFSKQN
jgi:hypothetical protein